MVEKNNDNGDSEKVVVEAAFDGEDYEPVGRPVGKRKPVTGSAVPVTRRTHNSSGRAINPAFLLGEPEEPAVGGGVAADFEPMRKPERRPAASESAARPVGSPSGEEKPKRKMVNPLFADPTPTKAPAPGESVRRKAASDASPPVRAAVKTDDVVVESEAEKPVKASQPKRNDNALGLLDDLRSESDDAERALPKRRVNPLFADPGGHRPARQLSPMVDSRDTEEGDSSSARRTGLPVRPAEMEKPKRGRPAGGSYRTKATAEVDVEDWSDDESTDTHRGFGGTVDKGFTKPEWAKGYSLTDRDFILMRFMARYRYAYIHQLARLVDTSPENVSQRLRVLEKRGFIRKEPITGRKYLWLTRKAGNLIADIQFGEIKKGSLSYVTVAHTAGIANLGVELERVEGGKDILGESAVDPDWPHMNRFRLGIWGAEGDKTLGEQTITEREIRQAQARWRGGRTTQEMRDLVDLAVSDTTAPELLPGNEGLFVVYGMAGKAGEHIPDLVVMRERDEEGKPAHIAIELEMTPKNANEWKRILRWYRDNGGMYSKVYYFTHRREIANALKRVDAEVGLGDRLVIRKYNPQNGNAPFWG